MSTNDARHADLGSSTGAVEAEKFGDALWEREVRRDERQRIAGNLRENVDAFAEFAADRRATVRLIALAISAS